MVQQNLFCGDLLTADCVNSQNALPPWIEEIPGEGGARVTIVQPHGIIASPEPLVSNRIESLASTRVIAFVPGQCDILLVTGQNAETLIGEGTARFLVCWNPAFTTPDVARPPRMGRIILAGNRSAQTLTEAWLHEVAGWGKPESPDRVIDAWSDLGAGSRNEGVEPCAWGGMVHLQRAVGGLRMIFAPPHFSSDFCCNIGDARGNSMTPSDAFRAALAISHLYGGVLVYTPKS